MHSHWKWVWAENQNTINLKSAFFIIIMLLHEGLTHIHSQIKPWLLFGESFTLSWLSLAWISRTSPLKLTNKLIIRFNRTNLGRFSSGITCPMGSQLMVCSPQTFLELHSKTELKHSSKSLEVEGDSKCLHSKWNTKWLHTARPIHREPRGAT